MRLKKAGLMVAVLTTTLLFFIALPVQGRQDKVDQTMRVLVLSSELGSEHHSTYGISKWPVISLVATKTTMYRITCEMKLKGGNCFRLSEGNTMGADIEKNQMILRVMNPATGKAQPVKFDITDSEPVAFLSVQIANKMSNSSEYQYTVPGYENYNCSGAAAGRTTISDSLTNPAVSVVSRNKANVNCNAVGAPSRTVNYTVHGATMSLLLPDGRLVVINCDSRPSYNGNSSEQRSCREPLSDEIQVVFDQDNARLLWNASVDGTTMGAESYKIIGILSKSTSQPAGNQ